MTSAREIAGKERGVEPAGGLGIERLGAAARARGDGEVVRDLEPMTGERRGAAGAGERDQLAAAVALRAAAAEGARSAIFAGAMRSPTAPARGSS